MTRRAPLRALIAGLSGLWLILALLEPVPLHACAMHDGGAGAPASHTVATDAPMPAGHHMHGMTHEHAPITPAKAPRDPHKACTCLGQCAGVTAVQLPAFSWLAVVPVALRRADSPLAPAQIALPSRADVRLPPANAPPVASLT